jgi:hypothetical protein
MFKTYDDNGNETTVLKDYLLEAQTIKTQSTVLAEWNLNIADNIDEIGNYRYRPNTVGSNFYTLPSTFIKETSNNGTTSKYYGATDADVVIDGAYDIDNNPTQILEENQKIKFYYSLEDCFNRFRPRSGINKAVYAKGKYSHFANQNMANRPRYYVADKTNIFKYWTSYRTEATQNGTVITNEDRGISKIQASPSTDGYYIHDSVPFVVYKSDIYANRIIIKMQTHVGDTDLGTFYDAKGNAYSDPFYGNANKAVPKKWKIDVLRTKDDASLVWEEAIDLSSYSINNDGYVELVFGPEIPAEYQNIFVYANTVADESALPEESVNGYAYLVEATNEYYIWVNSISGYDTFDAKSVWQTIDGLPNRIIPYAEDLVGDETTIASYNLNDGFYRYREFDLIRGLRLSVSTMTKQNIPFDLIELSPRLAVDLSDKTESFSIEKKASDLSTTGLPLGDILASTGKLSLFDYDQAFDKNNSRSIIQNISFKNLQFKFYQKIIDVDGYDYLIPIKTMYADGFPEENYSDRMLEINLRDLFFYFESTTAPTVFVRKKTLSYVISLLMDSIGYSNYVFKRTPNEPEIIIPDFYIAPDKNVAEVLQDLAKSTQISIFFDEDNNLTIMSKNYMMPSYTTNIKNGRVTDIVLSGSTDQQKFDSAYEKKTVLGEGSSIANIVDIKSESHDIYNDGKIVYNSKYIQKSVSNLDQVSKLDSDKTYSYQPVLLWELSEQSNDSNAESEDAASGYSLSAVTLASEIKDVDPSIRDNTIVDNIINVGESVYWLNNYSGYLFANGEIIKYDAKQYTVTGEASPVWISSKSDKDYYFSKIGYGGKLYPTGNIRIYTEVSYKENGDLDKIIRHGRAQFGTKRIAHSAGLSTESPWIKNVAGAANDFEYLNGTKDFRYASSSVFPPKTKEGTDIAIPAGKGIAESETGGVLSYYEDRKSFTTRNGIIKNYLSSSYITEIEKKTSPEIGAVQASALVMAGTKDNRRTSPINFISYSYNETKKICNTFGTRMRIMGQKSKDLVNIQNANGSMEYFSNEKIAVNDIEQNISISGGSGGIGIFLNPQTNAGYYFEIAALGSYASSSENFANLWFYKLKRKRKPEITNKTNIQISTYGKIDDATSNEIEGREPGALSTSILDKVPNKGDRVVISGQTLTQYNGYFKVMEVGNSTEKWKLERDELAIPEVLWSAKSKILADTTGTVGMSRTSPKEDIPVYDLKIKWIRLSDNSIKFDLYINDVFVGGCTDAEPTPTNNCIGLFVRGTSKCMFEHVYAVSRDYQQLAKPASIANSPKIFDLDSIKLSNTFNAYRLNEAIITDYLSSQTSTGFENSLYFEEFGTIMRECAYLNVRYDKAYPALIAKIANTYNPLLGYYVSNFRANPYGAEFMVFNTTDSPLPMDSSTGNYLRINGVAFTAESNNELTVDDFFNKVSDYSHSQFTTLPKNATNAKNDSILIKNSRITYGKKDFSLEAPYIQDRDTAYEMMDWMIQKIKKPKIAIGVEVFGLPIVQLGDILEINYTITKEKDGVYNDEYVQISPNSRFVVYAINYSVDSKGPSNTLYLSEVS